MKGVLRFRRPMIPFRWVAAVLLICLAGGAKAGEVWLPMATAPMRNWGGVICGEYDHRTIDSDDIAVQRWLFRLGWTPGGFMTVWGEGGVAALTLKTGGTSIDGDYGSAYGVGATATIPGMRLLGVAPFATARFTDFISRLGSEEIVSGVSQLRQSRFEWQEGSGFAGLDSRAGAGEMFGGVAVRALSQTEKRSTRVRLSVDEQTYSYKSGMKLGAAVGGRIPLPYRLSIGALAQVYGKSWSVGLTFGQWGVPYLAPYDE